MRSFAALISFGLILYTGCAWAESGLPPMVDPIFKLTFQPDFYTSRFVKAPHSLMRACGVEVSKLTKYRDWILASAVEPSGHYYLLAGILRDRKRLPPVAWHYDPNGAFVRQNGKTCVGIDPADGVFTAIQSYASDQLLPIPSKVFDDLATDAVRRYSDAFGSKAAFVAALHIQHRYPGGNDMTVLRDAVASYSPR
jgi:hypothetical protein